MRKNVGEMIMQNIKTKKALQTSRALYSRTRQTYLGSRTFVVQAEAKKSEFIGSLMRGRENVCFFNEFIMS